MSGMNRRRFIVGAGVAGTCVLFGSSPLFSMNPTLPAARSGVARFTRLDVSAQDFPVGILQDYSNAIATMLSLPPQDPRNWYRQALVHLLDCPHINWWFLPWHQVYLGWFEKICRDLSGNSAFALPYWNWTHVQRAPEEFFSAGLDPTSDMFQQSMYVFRDKLDETLDGIWSGLSDRQRVLLGLRGYTELEILAPEVRLYFMQHNNSRDLSQANPEFDDDSKQGTSAESIHRVLASRKFVGFGGQLAQHHSVFSGSDLLESLPHNSVHAAVGGTMLSMFSPIDPLFYLHHANVDRLWQVWTEMQTSEDLPGHPEPEQFEAWAGEYFEFFSDEHAAPVRDLPLQHYLQADRFDYSYHPLIVGETRPLPLAPVRSGTVYDSILSANSIGADQTIDAQVDVPAAVLLDALDQDGATLLVDVRMEYPVPASAWELELLLMPNSGSPAPSVSIGKLKVLDMRMPHANDQHGQHPAGSFALSVNAALSRLHATGGLDPNTALKLALNASLSGLRPPQSNALQIHGMQVRVVG